MMTAALLAGGRVKQWVERKVAELDVYAAGLSVVPMAVMWVD